MCDVPSIAVFGSESTSNQSFPDTAVKFSLNLLLLFRWLQLLAVQQYISCSTSAASLYTKTCVLLFYLLLYYIIIIIIIIIC